MTQLSVVRAPRALLARLAVPASDGRSRSVFAGALLQAAVAFVIAGQFPVELFLLAPILFGVPHVVADLRHLVLRRALPGWWRRTLLLGCALLLGLRAWDLWRPFSRPPALETLLVTAWALCAIVAASAGRASKLRVGLAAGGALFTGALGCAWPRAAALVLLHAHNLVALGALALLLRSRPRAVLSYGLLVLAAAFVLLSGGALGVAPTPALLPSFMGTHLLQVADWVAPGVRADYAIGIVRAFVFLQAVHYTIWLSIIPAQDVRPPSPPAGASGLRLRGLKELRADLGDLGLLGCGVAIVTLLVAACVQLQQSRAVYLSLANFHVYLELVMLTYFWVAAGRSGEPSLGPPRYTSRV